MTTIRQALPTRYLCADDLNGKELTLTIQNIDLKGEVWNNGKQETRPVLCFKEHPKGMVFNTTNANIIGYKLGYGKVLENWKGKQITVYPTTDNRVKGDNKDVVRVRPTRPGGKP